MTELAAPPALIERALNVGQLLEDMSEGATAGATLSKGWCAHVGDASLRRPVEHGDTSIAFPTVLSALLDGGGDVDVVVVRRQLGLGGG